MRSSLPALTNEDWQAIEREACRRSLAAFVRRAWHTIEPESQPYIHGWHVDAICEHLEAVTLGAITRLLINVPPGTMKSSLTGVFWPAWEWGPCGMQHLRVIGVAHEQGLATRDTLRMRRLVTSEWYQSLWPVCLTGDQNAKMYYENTGMGFRQACPMASATGKRGDRVIIDDPHSVEDAYSAAKLATATREFRETIPTRLQNPATSAIVLDMQRLNVLDMSEEALGLGYEHLCFPMEYEGESRSRTVLGYKDPRTKTNELLFPARFPREVVERDKLSLGSYGTAGQLQQRPSPLGGGIFKSAWWKYYTVLPRLQWRCIYVDTAQKTKEQNDYTVFQCWGRSYDGQAVLIDQIRDKWEAPELLTHARAFWDKHKGAKPQQGTLRAMKVEDKSSGTGLIQTLQREGVPIIAVQRDTDKVSRAMDAAPLAESGNVLIPETASWLSDWLTETAQFPNGTNDDQVDPMIDAIVDICGGGTIDYSAIL